MYYLGIDASGAYARLCGLDTDMRIIGKHTGLCFGEKGAELKRDGFKKLLSEFNRMTNTVLNDCLGLCFGVGLHMDKKRPAMESFFEDLALPFRVHIADEAALMLCAQFKQKDGVALFCGQNSWGVSYGSQDGRFEAGNFGPVLDDGLSAYGLGKSAIRAALLAFDGCAEKTALVDLIPAHYKLSDINAVKNAINKKNIDNKSVCALVSVINEAAAAGDAAARNIQTRAARYFCDLSVALSKKAQLEKIDIVVAGSVFSNGSFLHLIFCFYLHPLQSSLP